MGIELVGAGGVGSINYSYFRDNIMYQIGLGIVPDFKISGSSKLTDSSWLIPIQIQFQNPNYCECTMVNFDVGIWGRIDITKQKSEYTPSGLHAVGMSFKLKNYLRNEKDWIVQFGVYPNYDFNQKKMMTIFGLQLSK